MRLHGERVRVFRPPVRPRECEEIRVDGLQLFVGIENRVRVQKVDADVVVMRQQIETVAHEL